MKKNFRIHMDTDNDIFFTQDAIVEISDALLQTLKDALDLVKNKSVLNFHITVPYSFKFVDHGQGLQDEKLDEWLDGETNLVFDTCEFGQPYQVDGNVRVFQDGSIDFSTILDGDEYRSDYFTVDMLINAFADESKCVYRMCL